MGLYIMLPLSYIENYEESIGTDWEGKNLYKILLENL
jgi:hypothetical protein